MSRFKLDFNHNIATLQAGIVQEGMVSELADYFQMPDTFMNRINILEGIKSKTLLPDVSTNATLQAKTGCGFTAGGTTTWSDRALEVKPVYTNEEYCNESLVGKWTEMLLRLGLNGQNEELTPEAVITAMHMRNFTNKIWDGVWNGDYLNTYTNTPAELQFFDGFKKVIAAAASSINFASVAITNANAHAVFENFASAIPSAALENGITYEIRTSRNNARKVLLAIWREKDYSALVTGASLDKEVIEFNLPISGFKIVSDKYLSDTDIVAVPLNNAFLGTDAESDLTYLDSKYDEYNEKLRVTVQARVGVQTNKPEYWVLMTSRTSNKNTGDIDLEESITCGCPEPAEAE